MLASRYRVPWKRLEVILTPIDTSIFRPIDRATACHSTSLDPKRRYLLFVGRLHDQVKRVSMLIRTFTSLVVDYPDIDLLIVGDGPDEKRLRRLVAEQGSDRVHFLGWVSDTKTKVQLYNTAECLMLPSRKEGFPTVVGEAMACGIPVLASQVGGVGELIIEGETGWLILPGDTEALKAKLSFVLAHPEVVASMRPQVRRMAEARVSPAAVAAELRKCFQMESK